MKTDIGIYKKVEFDSKELPLTHGWYDTDKGVLYFFVEEATWSCRNDRISEEYPKVWYKQILQSESSQPELKAVKTAEEILESELGAYLKIREADLGERIIKCMREFANQFSQPKEGEIDPIKFAEWIAKNMYELHSKGGFWFKPPPKGFFSPACMPTQYSTEQLLQIYITSKQKP
mgnify:CR=1 FL=1